MKLTFGDTRPSYGKGIWVDRARIIAARNISGMKKNDFAEKPCEIGIQIRLDIGRDFQPVMSFAGDFSRTDGVITGWGSATGLRIFLSAMKVKGELTADNRLDDNVVKALVGKEIFKLTYVKGTKENGKLSYGTWNQVLPGDEGNDKKLVEAFLASVEKGFPKNYHPEALDQERTGEDVSFNPPSQNATTSDDQSVDTNDPGW